MAKLPDSKGTGLEPVLEAQEVLEAKEDLIRAITALRSLLTWLERPSNWEVSPNATFSKIARTVYPQTLPDFQDQQDGCITVLKEVYSSLFKGTGFGYKPQSVKAVQKPSSGSKGVTQPVEPGKEPVQAKKPVKTAPKQPVKPESEAGHGK